MILFCNMKVVGILDFFVDKVLLGYNYIFGFVFIVFDCFYFEVLGLIFLLEIIWFVILE